MKQRQLDDPSFVTVGIDVQVEHPLLLKPRLDLGSVPGFADTYQRLCANKQVAPKDWSGSKTMVYRAIGEEDKVVLLQTASHAIDILELYILPQVVRGGEFIVVSRRIKKLGFGCSKAKAEIVALALAGVSATTGVISVTLNDRGDTTITNCSAHITTEPEIFHHAQQILTGNHSQFLDPKNAACVALRQRLLISAGQKIDLDAAYGDDTRKAETAEAIKRNISPSDLGALYKSIAGEPVLTEQPYKVVEIKFKIRLIGTN